MYYILKGLIWMVNDKVKSKCHQNNSFPSKISCFCSLYTSYSISPIRSSVTEKIHTTNLKRWAVKTSISSWQILNKSTMYQQAINITQRIRNIPSAWFFVQRKDPFCKVFHNIRELYPWEDIIPHQLYQQETYMLSRLSAWCMLYPITISQTRQA